MQIKKLEEEIAKCKGKDKEHEIRHIKALRLVQAQVFKIEEHHALIKELEKECMRSNKAYAYSYCNALNMHCRRIRSIAKKKLRC